MTKSASTKAPKKPSPEVSALHAAIDEAQRRADEKKYPNREEAMGDISFRSPRRKARPDLATVPERLRAAADIYEERNALYKDNYIYFGDFITAIFPEGVKLETPAEFARFGLFVMILSKATRYANMFKQGGHADSLADISVYANMLAEVDELFKL